MHVGVCAVVVGTDKAERVARERERKKKKSTGVLSVTSELLYNY